MAATVIDEEGVNVGTSPTIYCNQPPYKLLCKINYAGSDAASAFTVGGTLAPYFQVVKPAENTALYGTMFGANDFYIAHSGTRLPDSFAGTGSTLTFDGPTGLTTLTPTIISSQGRPTTLATAQALYGNSVFALITTECWLRFKYAKDRSDTLFQGVPRSATFPDGVQSATSPTDLRNKINALAVGSGQKYQILCTDLGDGAWSTGFSATVAKNFMQGGGYLVIAPDPAAPPTIRERWFISQKYEGVEIRDFAFPGASGSNLCISIGAVDNQVSLRGITFVDPDWTKNTSASNTKTFVTVNDAKCFRMFDCKMTGSLRDITIVDTWFAEVSGCDVGQNQDDFCDPGLTCKHRGRWPSDDCVLMIHDGRLINMFDKLTGKHTDFSQFSTLIQYPGGSSGRDTSVTPNTYPAKPIAVGDYRIIGDNLYICTAAGTTPFRSDADNPVPPLPSHTSGTAVDGSDSLTNPTFLWVCAVKDMPKQYSIVYNNKMNSGGLARSGTDRVAFQFLINSSQGPILYAAFNNHSHTVHVLGMSNHCPQQSERNYYELNTCAGPHQHPAGAFYFKQGVLNGFSANNGKCRAYRNMAGQFEAAAFNEGNVIIRGDAVIAGQRYWDACISTAADFDLTGSDGVVRFAFQDDQLDTIEDSGSRLSKLLHCAGSTRIGARSKELWPLTLKVTDANGQQSNALSTTIAFLP